MFGIKFIVILISLFGCLINWHVLRLIDDGATVKTFYKEEGFIRLQPENDFMDPIIVRDCQILGKVIGVFRFFK